MNTKGVPEMSYKYYANWGKYAFPKSEGCLTSSKKIQQTFPGISLNAEKYKSGGLPLFVENDIAYVNNSTEMTAIFGETGSGKTRKLLAILLSILARSEESMCVLDVKGEFSGGSLSPVVRGELEKNGYDVKFIDFRELKSDCFNIFEIAYNLYKEGEIDKAMTEVSHIINTLASIYNGTKADPFWTQTATAYLMAIVFLVFETAPSKEYINMLTIASYASEEACSNMQEIQALIKEKDSSIMTMLKSVLSEPEKTRMSTLASAAAFMQSFLNNETLSRMLGQSTINLDDIYKKKTCLFIILPDEHSTYDQIAGLVMQQISSYLVSAAYKLGGKLPRRVNFIYDEFCNIFSMDGTIGRALSTHRSRDIRYYITAQGLGQLQSVAPRDYETILSNCKNIYFLNSSDRGLLKYLSEGSGISYENENEVPRPLLSIYDLQSLEKTWDYAECYVKSGDMQFVTKFPDIDCYKHLSKYKERYPVPEKKQKKIKVYDSYDMLYDLKNKIRTVSFKREKPIYFNKTDLF